MADNEIIMNIPLRRLKLVSRRRRSNVAIKLIELHVSKHLKIPLENVWIDPKLNEVIWKRGIEKPPSRISVKVVKYPEENTAEVYAA
ncbi:MAG: 50S ribosomal protein L31e [Thermoplasmata archaeon]|jgi:large subunit ribosomal protein L31e|nr:50S ribosomal protein L31e [Thermoplasmatales archaeon]PMP75254.1 MAG: 50S ribosomal protein L31e [Aciduliprofundum sp.]HEU12619.1 50S ribosomal protein L31e [Euryarchaeota archaeon]